MIDDRLHDELTRIADRIEVGVPPTMAIVRTARGHRQRRTTLVSAAAGLAIVALGIGTVAFLHPPGIAQTPSVMATPSAAATSPGSTVPAVAAGRRLIGVGRAVIDVPKSWGTNDVRCGTPMRDTVILDQYLVPTCWIARPAGVQSVELSTEPAFDFVANERFTIDGVAAQRQTTACPRHPYGAKVVCTGAVYLPSLDAFFHASVSASDGAEVDRILGRIHPAGGRVPVPGYQDLELASGRGGEAYIARLETLGLVPQVTSKSAPGYRAGHILAVEPAVGTVLTADATVFLTVASG